MNTIMNIIKPNKLQKGDKIGIVAPAGCVDSQSGALKSKIFLEKCGYEVVFGKNIFNKNRYLAGSDDEKIQDLHEFFENDEIKAILCLRGGYGCIRLAEKIDYDLVRNNPKIFAGYSDISALCALFFKRSKLITYHAPMAQSDFGTDNISDFTSSDMLKIFSKSGEECIKGKTLYKSGNAEGVLFGGNLATLTSLAGLDFIPDEKFIFFTEEINEPVYKIDRMFTQLLNIGKFRQNISGIVLGEFLNTDDSVWLEELFSELANELNIPTVGGFKITHSREKLTIPVGEKAKIIDNTLTFTY